MENILFTSVVLILVIVFTLKDGQAVLNGNPMPLPFY